MNHSWRDGRMYALSDSSVVLIEQMLIYISSGDGESAFELLKTIVRNEGLTHYMCVSHGLMMMLTKLPGKFLPTFDEQELAEMVNLLNECKSYRDIAGVILTYSQLAESRLGAF